MQIWNKFKEILLLHRLRFKPYKHESSKKLKSLMRILRKRKINVYVVNDIEHCLALSDSLNLRDYLLRAYLISHETLLGFTLTRMNTETKEIIDSMLFLICIHRSKFRYLLPLVLAHEMGHIKQTYEQTRYGTKDEELIAWTVARMLLGRGSLRGQVVRDWYNSYQCLAKRKPLALIIREARVRYNHLTGGKPWN